MTEAVYLETGPAPTFAVVHRPAPAVHNATGVVFCPMFGWEDFCTHRVRRNWAVALADAGHPTVRFDLPGTGDSFGSPQAPRRLEAWTAAVAGAATWLRQESGCVRVCAIGIGLGGLLAWRAAAEGAPIDDLALWATPLNGQQLTRHAHAAARLDINWELDRDRMGAAGPGDGLIAFEDGDMLDAAGQVTSRETVRELAGLDLRGLPLSDRAQRRVLLFAGPAPRADEELTEHLSATGVNLTLAPGDEYDAMMRSVRFAALPVGAVARSLAWLAEAAAPSSVVPREIDACRATRSVVVAQDGTIIRERPVRLDLPSGPAEAIITAPGDGPDAGLCVVFLNAAVDRRVGPNRLWVTLARRWAARGVAAVRVDVSGIGEADGPEAPESTAKAQYDRRRVRRTQELIDALAAGGVGDRFVLVGYCSGAYRAIHVAVDDPRVVAVLAVRVHFFRWSLWTVNVRDAWIEGWAPKPTDSRMKVLAGRVLVRVIPPVQRIHHRLMSLAQALPSYSERVIRRLDDRGTTLLLLLNRADLAHAELTQPGRRRRLSQLRHVRIRALPGQDIRFRPVASQRFVLNEMDRAFSSVLGTDDRDPARAMG